MAMTASLLWAVWPVSSTRISTPSSLMSCASSTSAIPVTLRHVPPAASVTVFSNSVFRSSCRPHATQPLSSPTNAAEAEVEKAGRKGRICRDDAPYPWYTRVDDEPYLGRVVMLQGRVREI